MLRRLTGSFATAVLLLGMGCSNGTGRNDEAPARPNLILIIGDGMDDQQITMARNYLAGSRGQLILDAMFESPEQI